MAGAVAGGVVLIGGIVALVLRLRMKKQTGNPRLRLVAAEARSGGGGGGETVAVVEDIGVGGLPGPAIGQAGSRQL
jgi:hypothetical protein